MKLTLEERLRALISIYELIGAGEDASEWDSGRRAAYDSVAEDLRDALKEATHD